MRYSEVMDCRGAQMAKVYFLPDFLDLCLSALPRFPFLAVSSFRHLDFLRDLCALEQELDSLAESDFFFACWLQCGLSWELSWAPCGAGSLSDEVVLPLGRPAQTLRCTFSCWPKRNTSFRHFPQAFSAAISSAVVSAHDMVHV